MHSGRAPDIEARPTLTNKCQSTRAAGLHTKAAPTA